MSSSTECIYWAVATVRMERSSSEVRKEERFYMPIYSPLGDISLSDCQMNTLKAFVSKKRNYCADHGDWVLCESYISMVKEGEPLEELARIVAAVFGEEALRDSTYLPPFSVTEDSEGNVLVSVSKE